MELYPGLKGKDSVKVHRSNTAIEVGSGKVPVFATPMLIALMESASIKAVENFLPAEKTTVGSQINCQHLAPTPIGLQVTAYAELIQVEEKILHFKLEAYDDQEKVGTGDHIRVLVDQEKFTSTSQNKITNSP